MEILLMYDSDRKTTFVERTFYETDKCIDIGVENPL